MAKYLKEFNTHSEYTTYINGQDAVLPNVSYCVDNNDVHYNPYIPPRMDIITYTASSKLPETTSTSSSGLHTNAFNTTIKSHTFENGIGTIEFNENVTTIGDNAFARCTGLTSITIPNSVTSIGDNAFYNCSGLTSVTIGNSVTSIGNSAFQSCSGLTSIIIPNSVTSIGEDAFSNCGGLTSITIGNGVTSIGSEVFSGCSSLTSITIPNNVTSINENAFSHEYFTSIVVSNGNSTYDSRDNCNAIIETATNKLIVGCQNTTIPNTVTSIGDSAFSACSGLTSVTIPNSVTSIGEDAFSNCGGLTSITLGDSVTSIGRSAFYGCESLTSITIPNSVTSIGNYAFQGCTSLTNVTIGNGITSIGDQAFDNCPSIESFNISAVNPPYIDGYIFSNNCQHTGSGQGHVTPIYVPTDSEEAYKQAWADYECWINMPDDESE